MQEVSVLIVDNRLKHALDLRLRYLNLVVDQSLPDQYVPDTYVVRVCELEQTILFVVSRDFYYFTHSHLLLAVEDLVGKFD